MFQPPTADSMRNKYGMNDDYHSPARYIPPYRTWFPSAYFYFKLLTGPLGWLCFQAARHKCDDAAWSNSSAWLGDIIEEMGCAIHVSGLSHIDSAQGPCIFIANHMSTLETFLLPGLIRPKRPVTFVVKKSLVSMPLFGSVMRSRNPVVVGRSSAREDLATVLEEGRERLEKGISIIVFPQSTRSMYFSPEHFNSIGIKLARKANVPVIPLALKTDAWGQGKKIKEAGKILPRLPIRFKFGSPVAIKGSGKAEHLAICEFIGNNLSQWQIEDGVNI